MTDDDFGDVLTLTQNTGLITYSARGLYFILFLPFGICARIQMIGLPMQCSAALACNINGHTTQIPPEASGRKIKVQGDE